MPTSLRPDGVRCSGNCKSWPSSERFGAKLGRKRARFDLVRGKFCRTAWRRPTLVPRFVRARPRNSAKGRSQPVWLTSVTFGPPDIGQNWLGVGQIWPDFGRNWPDVCQFRSNSALNPSNLAEFGRDEFGQIRPDLGRIRITAGCRCVGSCPWAWSGRRQRHRGQASSQTDHTHKQFFGFGVLSFVPCCAPSEPDAVWQKYDAEASRPALQVRVRCRTCVARISSPEGLCNFVP